METNWTLLNGLLAIPGLAAEALIWIYFQDRKIRSWKEAPGRIVSSSSIARTIRQKHYSTPINAVGRNNFDSDETLQTRNFADVRYSFSVDGKLYSGKRISLAVDKGDVDVAAVLKRYPEGAAVTVIYDPGAPASCLLERDDPKNIRLAWLSVVGLAAFIVVTFFGAGPIVDFADHAMSADAPRPLVAFAAAAAFIIACFAYSVTNQTRAMKKWPRAPGQIVRSMVETTTHTHNVSGSSKTTATTMYVARVVYKFEVDGISYQGDNFGGATSSSQRAGAERTVEKYPLYSPVAVYYNPENPAESAAKRSGGVLAAILWTLAFAAAFLAYALAVGAIRLR